jgi:hypothetical protein
MQQLEKPGLAESHLNCSHSGAVHGNAGRLSAGNAASIGGGRHDWRQKLASDLQAVALDSQELIIRHVNSICRDLKTRCNAVEEQLKEELAKAIAWQSELDAADAEHTATCLQKVELEGHLLQTCEALAAETEEKIELQRFLDVASKREKRLAQELADYAKAVSDTKATPPLTWKLDVNPHKWLQTQ